jgi:hypothetical protein
MMVRHYLNLTNGIEAIELFNLDPQDVHFIRIQSTTCEQKRWAWLLDNLDTDFLLHLAMGTECIVYDGTTRGRDGVPRALWQGLEFVKYVLEKVWFNQEYDAPKGMSAYFAGVFNNLPKPTLIKIKQFRRYLQADELKLRVVSWKTDHDGDYLLHIRQLRAAYCEGDD